jgi:hypothetical protein
LRAGYLHGQIVNGISRALINDRQDLPKRLSRCFRILPPRKLLGRRIQEAHSSDGVGGYHRIGQASQRNLQQLAVFL